MWRYRMAALVVSGLMATGCANPMAAGYVPRTPTPRPIISPPAPADAAFNIGAPIEPAVSPTPTVVPTATPTPTPRPTRVPDGRTERYVLTGLIYDAAAGTDTGLHTATIEWRYLGVAPPAADGQRAADATGAYRLVLDLAPGDEIALTVRAPGYAPSSVRLKASLFTNYRARLNFSLNRLDAPPTVPGDLGLVEVRGLVYNAARGQRAPIEAAAVYIVQHSMVRASAQLTLTTSPTGTFAAPVTCHTADRLEFIISAPGFVTATVSRRASDLAEQPQLLIALQPLP